MAPEPADLGIVALHRGEHEVRAAARARGEVPPGDRGLRRLRPGHLPLALREADPRVHGLRGRGLRPARRPGGRPRVPRCSRRQKDLELIRMAAEAPGPIVIISDHADENLISPAWYREYCIPYYNKACAILHAAGKKVSTHLDGNFKGYFPFITETGFDLLDGCTPAPMFNFEPEELAAATSGTGGRKPHELLLRGPGQPLHHGTVPVIAGRFRRADRPRLLGARDRQRRRHSPAERQHRSGDRDRPTAGRATRQRDRQERAGLLVPDGAAGPAGAIAKTRTRRHPTPGTAA